MVINVVVGAVDELNNIVVNDVVDTAVVEINNPIGIKVDNVFSKVVVVI